MLPPGFKRLKVVSCDLVENQSFSRRIISFLIQRIVFSYLIQVMKSNYSLLLKFLSQPLVYCENELTEIFYYFINFYFYYFIIERKNEQLREISLILVRFLYLSNFFKISSKLGKLTYFNSMPLSFKCFPLFCKNFYYSVRIV